MTVQKSFFKFTMVISILVGTLLILSHEWFFDRREVDITLPENWKQMSTQEKLDRLDRFFSKNTLVLLLSKINQLTIKNQLRKRVLDKQDEILKGGAHYSFSFRYSVGWKELGFLGLIGFVAVWVIYAFGRVLTLMIPYVLIEKKPKRPRKPRAVWID